MNNKITFNEQETAVFAFLKEKGISFKADYLGMNSDPKWKADRFSVVMWRGNGKRLTSDYKTGIGHRVGRKAGLTAQDKKELAKVDGKAFIVDEANWTSDDRKGNDNKTFSFGFRVYVPAPCAASVLYSLISDMSLSEESHEDFCANLGYDEDSRKGLESYLACQKSGNELKSFFSHAEREELAELLEDY